MRAGAAGPRLVLATRNPGKVREIAAIYAHLNMVCLSLVDYPGIGEVAEEGATYVENATAKARAAAAATGLVALSDDSGVEVDALDGAPGVHSARFAGAGATDAERHARLLALLEGIPEARRTARYRAIVAVALPPSLTDRGTSAGPVRVFEGVCEGGIARAPRGIGGFGYDPIFVPAGEARTMAEIPPDVKNRISHRARALRAAEGYVADVLRLLGEDRRDEPPNTRGAGRATGAWKGDG
ncbi:MAG: non-canonical purine NTP pyrophosphatase, RdgB/HAM1 family [Armatimonadetes bacterium 13_1_40CM_3_65_7]|nr:MAG: non-canonical purine NTP pyrophosphatase, RdgB/HAM1 family [Armatimonadetes bacterium 13_1_40CM_3_65_7]